MAQATHIVASRVVMVSSSPDVVETQTATISFDSDLKQESKAEVVEMDVAKQPVYPDRANGEGGNGCSVSFHEVCYEVPQKKCFVRKPSKVILKSVSGLLHPGLNVIMGRSGSGKTTLLDVLAHRKSSSFLSGTVLVNGERPPSNFKCISGYVVQDDIVMGTLSVRENLSFSAALRLNMGSKERKARVDKVIHELGLDSCADTKVGTEFLRGVSGGERKRTNIGMELIIEPQVLFLDEPTTGLDANTAVSVVKLLKDLSLADERIVIMSIHQPRYAIFKLFDSLTLLSRGEVVYHGNALAVLPYFQRLGYPCEEHENPADFLLDVITRHESYQGDNNAKAEKETVMSADEASSSRDTNLAKAYLESSYYSALSSKLDPIMENLSVKEKTQGIAFGIKRKDSVTYATNVIWQLLVLCRRSALNLLRNPTTSVFQLITLTFFALVIGGIYFKRSLTPLGFQDRIGVFFFIATNQAFGSLSAIDLFIKQRALFIHENASGFYRVSAFFISKVLTDLIPLRIIPNSAFAVITYFMIGFQLDAAKFFIYLLLINLASIAAVSIAFAVSAGVRINAVANLLIAILFVVSMLFGGLLITLQSLPAWIGWMKYLSFVRYIMEAFVNNEVVGLMFSAQVNITVNGTVIEKCTYNPCIVNGTEQIMSLGWQVGWLWYDVAALIIFATLFQSLAYIILRCIKKEK